MAVERINGSADIVRKLSNSSTHTHIYKYMYVSTTGVTSYTHNMFVLTRIRNKIDTGFSLDFLSKNTGSKIVVQKCTLTIYF